MYLHGNTKPKCVSNIVANIKKLRSLGFTIHAGKSNLISTQKLEILGFTIDSVDMTISLKEPKKKDIRNLISKTIAKTSNQENSASITWINVWCFILSAHWTK